MAAYNEARGLIIKALMGRSIGSEIQPEAQQVYELNMLDYIRSLELISASTLIGLADTSTIPVQPKTSKVCYVAGVAQNKTEVFNNFTDKEGNHITIKTGDVEGAFVIFLWDTKYWVANTFTTKIISSEENSSLYYNYNIKKIYVSVADMNADSSNPVGTDGATIKIGDLVNVLNSSPPENAFYSRIEGGWHLQSGFNFQVEQSFSIGIDTVEKTYGYIRHDASAPTDGISRMYKFISAGSCTWITNGAESVEVGDEINEIFSLPSTYVYELVKSNAVNNSTKSNSDFNFALTDSDGKVCFGVRVDGTVYIPRGMSNASEVEFLTLNVVSNNEGITVKDDKKSLDTRDNYTSNSATKQLLAVKGKILKEIFDSVAAETPLSIISNSEFLHALVDVDNRVLMGFRSDGSIYISKRISIGDKAELDIVSNSEFLYAFTDKNNRVLFGIRIDGTLFLNNALTEINDSIESLKAEVSSFSGSFEELDKINEFELSVGLKTSSGSVKSEQEFTTITNHIDTLLSSFSTVNKRGVKKNNFPKRILAINHDDLTVYDYKMTRKMLNKYGFTSTFNYIIDVPTDRTVFSERIYEMKKLIEDGNEISIHSLFGASYFFINHTYDIRPDETTTFAPSLSDLMPIGETGYNSQGFAVNSDSTFPDLLFILPPNPTVKVVDATQTQWLELVSYYTLWMNVQRSTGLGIDNESVVTNNGHLGWLEYWYYSLIDTSLGYSSISGNIFNRFIDDYDIPVTKTLENVLLYYPTKESIISGRMAFYDEITSEQIVEGYQSVGRFNKGLFKGCASNMNIEVLDRILLVVQAYCRYFFGLDHLTGCGVHGASRAYANWKDAETNYYYLDSGKILLFNDATRIYSSRLGVKRSFNDILLSLGIKTIMNNGWGSGIMRPYEGQTAWYYGQRDIRPNYLYSMLLPSPVELAYYYLFDTYGDPYPACSYDRLINIFGEVDNWARFILDNSGKVVANSDSETDNISDGFRQNIERIVETFGTGKIPQLSYDTTYCNFGTTVLMELLYEFCYLNDIEIVGYEKARQICLSNDKEHMQNHFPNPSFIQTIKNTYQTKSERCNMPDGFHIEIMPDTAIISVSKEDVIIDTVTYNIKVFVLSDLVRFSTRTYALKPGTYKFSCFSKVDGDTAKIEIALKQNKVNYHPDCTDGIPFSFNFTQIIKVEDGWKEIIYIFEIPELEVDHDESDSDIKCGGYQNNVNNVYIRFSNTSALTTLKLAKPKIINI